MKRTHGYYKVYISVEYFGSGNHWHELAQIQLCTSRELSFCRDELKQYETQGEDYLPKSTQVYLEALRTLGGYHLRITPHIMV